MKFHCFFKNWASFKGPGHPFGWNISSEEFCPQIQKLKLPCSTGKYRKADSSAMNGHSLAFCLHTPQLGPTCTMCSM